MDSGCFGSGSALLETKIIQWFKKKIINLTLLVVYGIVAGAKLLVVLNVEQAGASTAPAIHQARHCKLTTFIHSKIRIRCSRKSAKLFTGYYGQSAKLVTAYFEPGF